MSDVNIREMREGDRDIMMDIMKRFYASDAVGTNGSEEIFQADLDACIGDSPYADGFIIEVDGNVAGYSMIARSFSTEFGGKCIWIEDLFLEEKYRGMRLSSMFFEWLYEHEDAAAFRLEVEADNEAGIRSYLRNDFHFLDYKEMIRFKK